MPEEVSVKKLVCDSVLLRAMSGDASVDSGFLTKKYVEVGCSNHTLAVANIKFLQQ